MKKIEVEGTSKTPGIVFDNEKGSIEIKGRSIPENSIEFYRPLLNWIEEYSENPLSETQVNVQLEYFNTSSSKCILDIFKKLEGINQNGTSKVLINWYYEEDDEDMFEAGEDYQAIIDIPFVLKEVKEF